jgi:hypothetical protein
MYRHMPRQLVEYVLMGWSVGICEIIEEDEGGERFLAGRTLTITPPEGGVRYMIPMDLSGAHEVGEALQGRPALTSEGVWRPSETEE